MALIRCSECQRVVSDKAPTCPGCGFPIAAPFKEATDPSEPPSDSKSRQQLEDKWERWRTKPASAPTLSPPGIAPQQQRPPEKADQKKGPVGKVCLGCLGVTVVVLVIANIMYWAGPSVTVTGDSGHMHHRVSSNFGARLAGSSLAEQVYLAATKHPEIKSLTVELELGVAGGVVDRYGKTVDGPLIMGTITVDDLNEVRRYNDVGAYARAAQDVYGVQLKGLDYSNLLKE
jgi:hypothetical protein